MANVRIGVTLRTAGGTFQRISEDVVDVGGTTFTAADDHLVYPDRRVEEFQLYTDASGAWQLHTTFPAIESEVLNLSYAEVPAAGVDLSTGAEGSDQPNLAVNQDVERDGNKVLASGTGRPRELVARRVYAAGNGPNDTVVGFASNAEPVSEGQYGQYPLFALCRSSIWSFQPAGADPEDLAFIDRKPLSTERGCVGRYAFTAVDNVVAFASRDGVYVIDGRVSFDSLSEPITTGTFVQAFADCLGAGTSLGTLHNANLDRVEVWVASGVLTFVYSTRHGRWAILERNRRYFFDYRGVLYGVSKVEGEELTDGILYDEAGITRDPPELPDGFDDDEDPDLVEWGLKMAPLHLDAPGVRKRIWRLAVRQDVTLEQVEWTIKDRNLGGQLFQLMTGRLDADELPNVFNIYSGQANQPEIELSGTGYAGQGIVSVELEYELRRPHRRRTTIARVGRPDAPGSAPFGWDCSDGITYPFNVPPELHLWDVGLIGRTDPLLHLWDVTFGHRGVFSPTLHLWDVDVRQPPEVAGQPPAQHLWDVTLFSSADEGAGAEVPVLHLWDILLGSDEGERVGNPQLTVEPSPVVLVPNGTQQYFTVFVTHPDAVPLDYFWMIFKSATRPTEMLRFPSSVWWQVKTGPNAWQTLPNQYVQVIFNIDTDSVTHIVNVDAFGQHGAVRGLVAYDPQPAEDGLTYNVEGNPLVDTLGNVGSGNFNVSINY